MTTQTHSRIWIWSIAIPLFLLAKTFAGEKKNQRGATGPTFAGHVQPFLKTHCLKCHGVQKQRGKITLHNVEADFSDGKSAALWERVMEQLRFGLMPPRSAPRPKSPDAAKVVAWIEAQLQKSGRYEAYARKLLLPEYGNYVNHEMLFSGEIKTLPYSSPRLWRLSPEIYLASKRRGAKSPFVYPTGEAQIRDYAASSKVDQSTVEMIMVTVEQMIEDAIIDIKGRKIVRFNKKKGTKKVINRPPQTDHRYAPFVSGKSPTSEQMQRLIADEYRTIHGRLPNDSERKRYGKFLKANIKAGGSIEGMKATVLALHLNPQAIFRMELGLGGSDKLGRRRLSDTELAHALSYALTDLNPYRNRLITNALGQGRLKSKKGIQDVVRKHLRFTTKKGGRKRAVTNPRIMRFFRQYFGYQREVFKDATRITQELVVAPGTYSPRRLQNDLEVLIEHILKKDKNVLAELLTTNEYFVAHPGQERLASLLKAGTQPKPIAPQRRMGYVFTYNLPHLLPLGEARNKKWNWVKDQPLAFPKQQRAGVLTHPAWLTAHSTNFDNDPIHRGLWVQKKLLAGAIQDVPPDVNAQVPEDPHKTLRQRMDVVRAKSCWRCHQKINPLGETFETYDDFGRFRAHHYFDQEKNLVTRRDGMFFRLKKEGKLTRKPVDATGYLEGTGDAKLDGPVTDAVDLMHRLAKSDRVRQCFVRYVFRYFMGRNETLNDSQTLIQADRAYVESGGSFKELVVSLLSSDSFAYRK